MPTVEGLDVPFMIGITQDTGNGSCLMRRSSLRREAINGTRFDPGDYAISVKWYLFCIKSAISWCLVCRLERLPKDIEQKAFQLDNDCTEQFVINSTELRLVGVEMDEVVAGAPPRRSARATTAISSRASQGLHRSNRRRTYALPTQTEQFTLETCHWCSSLTR